MVLWTSEPSFSACVYSECSRTDNSTSYGEAPSSGKFQFLIVYNNDKKKGSICQVLAMISQVSFVSSKKRPLTGHAVEISGSSLMSIVYKRLDRERYIVYDLAEAPFNLL